MTAITACSTAPTGSRSSATTSPRAPTWSASTTSPPNADVHELITRLGPPPNLRNRCPSCTANPPPQTYSAAPSTTTSAWPPTSQPTTEPATSPGPMSLPVDLRTRRRHQRNPGTLRFYEAAGLLAGPPSSDSDDSTASSPKSGLFIRSGPQAWRSATSPPSSTSSRAAGRSPSTMRPSWRPQWKESTPAPTGCAGCADVSMLSQNRRKLDSPRQKPTGPVTRLASTPHRRTRRHGRLRTFQG